jgi:tRNA pseudouridine55 synthase
MARRNANRTVHGWIVLDKPLGLTSAAAVSIVRRAAQGAKAGHGGTLDPLATGVLPIALGEATKTMGYVTDSTKRYRFVVRWGEQRDTDDAEGAVIAHSAVRPDSAQLEAALPAFRGRIAQVPPTYSAVKVAGQRAYALARAQHPIELTPREVAVDAFDLVDVPDGDHATFEVTAGKGVYMRALARDLALAVGTVGHVVALRRLAVGPFVEDQAVDIDRIRAAGGEGGIAELLLPMTVALAGIPALDLTEAEARRLQQGRPVAALPVARRSPLTGVTRDTVLFALTGGRPVALARIRGGEIRPFRVLNTT